MPPPGHPLSTGTGRRTPRIHRQKPVVPSRAKSALSALCLVIPLKMVNQWRFFFADNEEKRRKKGREKEIPSRMCVQTARPPSPGPRVIHFSSSQTGPAALICALPSQARMGAANASEVRASLDLCACVFLPLHPGTQCVLSHRTWSAKSSGSAMLSVTAGCLTFVGPLHVRANVCL